MTFKHFLAGLRAGSNARGDFLRLAKADPDMAEAESWLQLWSLTLLRDLNSELVAGAAAVWKEYQMAARHQGTLFQRKQQNQLSVYDICPWDPRYQ